MNNPISPSFWCENCKFTPEEKARLKRLPNRKKPCPDKVIGNIITDVMELKNEIEAAPR